MFPDECKYWCVTCQHSQGELCQSARSFPQHCCTTCPWLRTTNSAALYQTAVAKRLVVLNFQHSGKSTVTLNDKITTSAGQCPKIQLRNPKKRRIRVRRNRHSAILQKHRWEVVITYFKILQLNAHFLITNTFYFVNTLCAGQLPCSLFKTPSYPAFLHQSESCLCSYKA